MTSSEDKKKFGAELRKQLDQKNMMQADLAEALDVSQAYVSSLSTGTKRPSANGVEAISRALNLSSREEVSLHRAAAKAQGFKLDLPDDF